MMAGAVPALFRFDRWDERIGMLPICGELVHTEEINGEDTIEFSSWEVPEKGDRLLWDDGGRWREHVVVRTDEPIEGPCFVYAESSLCELLGDYIEDKRLVRSRPSEALSAILGQTRWEAGDAYTWATGSCQLYHMNALAALRKAADVLGCEAEAVIEVDGGRVSRRIVRMPRQVGVSRGLRFSYGKNITGCTRTVLEDEVYTALYGYGAGIPVTDEDGGYTGGYRRKLTFGEINDGLNYVEDIDALEKWGLWNAERTAKVHRFGQVTFSDCDEKWTLRNLTRRALAQVCQPQVSYEVDVSALGDVEAGLGDTVAVVDSSRTPEWRLKARIVRRVRTFGDCVLTRVTIGAVQKANYAAVSSLAADVATLQDDVVGIDGQLTATATTDYIDANVGEAVDSAVENLTDLGESVF